MCCFSGPVKLVAKTKIFARGLPEGRQALAYAMDVDLDQELAMVLPLPVPPRPAEDAVRFVDLSGYERLFDDLERAFPPMLLGQPLERGFGAPAPAAPTLVVHEVGDFEASFVPTHADFVRLDRRFRLPDGVWSALPEYADWGFAVFRLKPKKKGLFGGTKRQSIHPMAFSFPRRDPNALYFPTRHVHDGAVHAKAHFDHALYCQADGLLEATLGWTPSTESLGAFVSASLAKDLVDGARGGFNVGVNGDLPNADVWLRPPAGVTLADLRGEGELYAYAVKARSLHQVTLDHGSRAAWQRTAREKLPALCAALREGMRALTEARRDDWKLVPPTPDLPRHFVNGNHLWAGEDWMTGRSGVPGGPGRVFFHPFTDAVEPQEVVLGFRELPGNLRLDAIQRELRELLDRV